MIELIRKHLSSFLRPIVEEIITEGIQIGTHTIYLRPTYIDMQNNALKKIGTLTFGTGEDTNLYRSGVDTLKTDDTFEVAGTIKTDIIQNYSSGDILLKALTSADLRVQNMGVVLDNIVSIGWYNNAGTKIERIISLDEYDSFVIRGGSPGISDNSVRYVSFDMLGNTTWNQIWRIWDETPADTDYSDPGASSDLPSAGASYATDIVNIYRDYKREGGDFSTYIKLFPAKAESKTSAQIRKSPLLVFISRYWDGYQSQDAEAKMQFEVTTTSPLAANFYLSLLGTTVLNINSAGNLTPGTPDSQDMGNDASRWRDLYLSRTLDIELDSSIGDGDDYIRVKRNDLASDEPVFWLHEEQKSGGGTTDQITHLQVRGPLHAYVAKDVSADSFFTPYIDLADVNWSWALGLGASGNTSGDTTWLYFSWVYGTGSYQEIARIDNAGFLQIRSGITTLLGGTTYVPTDQVPLYIAVQSSHAANLAEFWTGSNKVFYVANDGNPTINHASSPSLIMQVGGTDKFRLTFNGTDTLLDAVTGNIYANANLLPYGSYSLGSLSSKWLNAFLSGYADIGSLRISGTEVLTSGRVLQNVSADAGIITSGLFNVARIPDLDASKIVSGVFDVDRIPNLDASKITSGVFDLVRIPSIDWTRMPFDDWNELLAQLGNTVGDYLSLSYLQINGSTVLTSGRVLQNIASIAQSLLSDGDNTRDLGSLSYRWRNLYIGTDIYLGGDIRGDGQNAIIDQVDGSNAYFHFRSYTGSGSYVNAAYLNAGKFVIAASGNILPASTRTHNIGTPDLRYYDLFLGHSLNIELTGSIGNGNNYISVIRSDLAADEPVFWLHEESIEAGSTDQITHLQVRGPVHAYINKDVSVNISYTPYIDVADANWSWTAGLGASGPSSSDDTWLYFSWVYGTGSYTEVARFDKDGFLQVKSGITTVLGGSVSVPTSVVPLDIEVQSSHAADIMKVVRGTSTVFEIGQYGHIIMNTTSTSVIPINVNAPSGQAADLLKLSINNAPMFQVSKAGDITVQGQIYVPNMATSDIFDDIEIIKNIRSKPDGTIDPESLPEFYRTGNGVNLVRLVGLLLGAIKQLLGKIDV